MRAVLAGNAIGICLSGFLAAGAALAQGAVTLEGNLTQLFQLRDGAGDNGFSARSTVFMNLSSKTATTEFGASGSFALNLNTDGDVEFIRPNLSVGYNQEGKTLDTFFGVAFSRTPVEYDEEQPDLSIVTETGDRIRVRPRFTLNKRLNSTTTAFLQGQVLYLDYEPDTPALIPSITYTLVGALNRDMTNRTTAGLAATFSLFQADNAINTESLSYGLNGNISHALTSRSAVNASLGVTYTDTTTDTGDRDKLSLVGGAGIEYELPRGSAGFSVNQTVSPSSAGTLVLDSNVRASFRQSINRNSGLGVAVAYTRQEDLDDGDVTTFLSVVPSYSVRINETLNGRAQVIWQRNDNGNTSQRLQLVLVKDFILPVR